MPAAATFATCQPIVGPLMAEADATVLAHRFRALSDPTRVRILNLLARHHELCVCELQAVLPLSQPTISHHLAVLRKAGFVDCEARGRWCYYWARPESLRDLSATLEA